MDDSERLIAALERATNALVEATAEIRSLRANTADLRYSTERLTNAVNTEQSKVVRLARRRP